MTNILWIIIAAIVGLWLLSIVFKILGFMVGIALWVLHWALIVALVLVVINFITGRKNRI